VGRIVLVSTLFIKEVARNKNKPTKKKPSTKNSSKKQQKKKQREDK